MSRRILLHMQDFLTFLRPPPRTMFPSKIFLHRIIQGNHRSPNTIGFHRMSQLQPRNWPIKRVRQPFLWSCYLSATDQIQHPPALHLLQGDRLSQAWMVGVRYQLYVPMLMLMTQGKKSRRRQTIQSTDMTEPLLRGEFYGPGPSFQSFSLFRETSQRHKPRRSTTLPLRRQPSVTARRVCLRHQKVLKCDDTSLDVEH